MHVVLIDDHEVIVESLSHMLAKHDEITRITCITSVAAFMEQPPVDADVIVCDLIMPGNDGMRLIEYCRKNLSKQVKIIVLSSLTEPTTIKRAVRLGANGYLAKNVSTTELLECIRIVYGGEQYVARNLRDSIINDIFIEEQASNHLSPREKEVLLGICDGLSIKEVAKRMNLSAHTIQTYHRSVMRKLKLSKSTELIIYAIQHGLYIPPARHTPYK